MNQTNKGDSFVHLSQPVLLATGFAILVMIAFASGWLMTSYRQDAAAVTRTIEDQRAISNLLLQIRRAESGQRGYLLTGDRQYLTDYFEAAAAIDPTIAAVKGTLADNPDQRQNLVALERSMRQKLAELDETIRLYDAGQKEDSLALVKTDTGRRFMEDIRTVATRMLNDFGRQLAEQSQRSRDTGVLLLAASLAGALLIIVLAALSVYLVRRSNRQRDLAQRKLEDANANLEATVAERTADLTEANDEIQRYAYIVSHDLRSPLVNIMGFTTELETVRKELFGQLAGLREKSGVADDQAEVLGRDFDEAISFIKTSITKMDRLINAILKLSREGRREFHPEAVDMVQLLNTVAANVAHQVSEAGATITFDHLPPVVCDRLALEQIFSNLVDNALKYRRNDLAGHIQIRGRQTLGRLEYDVEDNGRGIDPNDHQRIFELFRRSGPQDRPGEGIGLAHVRALVRRLGGTLSVRSELNKGSIFTVSLPRRWLAEERNAA